MRAVNAMLGFQPVDGWSLFQLPACNRLRVPQPSANLGSAGTGGRRCRPHAHCRGTE
jgi:hypothetical protein